MTKSEIKELHDMQENNPVNTAGMLEELWEIGDTAEIPHYSCYDYMLKQILISAEISDADKNRAITIFYRKSYADGRKHERRDTGRALDISWYE
jgi:hypothetical protein